jgi:hypothetical protein
MTEDIRIVTPAGDGKLKGFKGEILTPPIGWVFLPAGDAGVTRKVSAKGFYWKVQTKKGRRTISLGLWAPEDTVTAAKQAVKTIRSTDDYQKKQLYAAKRRETKQAEYDLEFCAAVETFLAFHSSYKLMEQKLAKLVTAHAIPVGSGTVARTQLIPIEERAALAVIAWMRHQTTSYDEMKIARIKGERRSVRKLLAQQSSRLLAKYRQGEVITETCPLYQALKKQ